MQLPSHRPSTKRAFHGQSLQAASNQVTASAPQPLNSNSKPLHQQSPRSGEEEAQTAGLAMGVSAWGPAGGRTPEQGRRQKRGSHGKPLAFLFLSRRRDCCIRLSRRQGGRVPSWAWGPVLRAQGGAGCPYLVESQEFRQERVAPDDRSPCAAPWETGSWSPSPARGPGAPCAESSLKPRWESVTLDALTRPLLQGLLPPGA